MDNITEKSPTWYAKESDKVLTYAIKQQIKQDIEKELLEEYSSVLAKANWFQTIGLNIKIQGLKEERIQDAIQSYLKSHGYPEASDESLW